MDLLFFEEAAAEAATTESQRRPKKRVLNAARKEQNRSAQRAYRKRQKERRERLRDESLQRSERQSTPQLLPQPPLDNYTSYFETQPNYATSNSSSKTKLFINSGGPASAKHDTFSSSPVEISPSTPGDARGSELQLPDTEDTMLAGLVAFCHSDRIPHRTRDGQRSSAVCTNSSYIADPGASKIHFMQNTVFSAIMHNAICLGFDLNETDPKDLLTSANLPTTNTMPANLRPTLSQLLIPHHASLDLIPLPLFRERAIMLSAAMPFAYNLTEFKTDIFVRGVTNTKGSYLQPWDSECWEAAPWFLEKWSIVVDGRQGELGRRSLRWTSVREV
ncbi:hypothetical protein V8C43DRAFT_326890 [Trichoderma afarasin]